MKIENKLYGKCWICNNDANSKEHKIKQTVFKRALKKVNKSEEFQAYKINDNYLKPIQGPDSKLIKFKPVICKYCNDTFSQPFDLAYDVFIEYIENNFENLIKNQTINFKEIFPKKTKEEQKNVYKYFIKYFGCILAENEIEITQEIKDYIFNKTKLLNTLLIKFEVDFKLYYFLKKLSSENILYSNFYKGSVEYFEKKR